MYKKLFLLVMIVCILSLNVFSQNETSKSQETAARQEVSSADAVQNALKVGDKMPDFSLYDGDWKEVSSSELLRKGNLVVVFYRGAWCPYCNLYLKNLQENLAQIKAQGANVVAISIEVPVRSKMVAGKNKVEFAVLSDPKLRTARRFGIVYDLPEATNRLYKKNGIDLAEYNQTKTVELPLSATYIVNREGEIVYAFVEQDYTKRAAPAVIIETLSKMKN
jgi:peroxiredoxin